VTGDGLIEQAQRFATEISETIRGLVPDCAPFTALAVQSRVSVEQSPATGIPLRVNGRPLPTLKVSFRCEPDTSGAFLAVEKSSFEVYEGAKAAGEPLFRYDYVRKPQSQIPAAHLQVHAHRDAITYVMSQAGTATPRGKRRANATEVPRLAELHFPLGGHRFRPCLEDLLEMLVSEFGVDSTKASRESLRQGRERWRRQQTRSVVRDAPDEAVAILTELCYQVTAPAEPPIGSTARLRAL
jgi:hypothetical protein